MRRGERCKEDIRILQKLSHVIQNRLSRHSRNSRVSNRSKPLENVAKMLQMDDLSQGRVGLGGGRLSEESFQALGSGKGGEGGEVMGREAAGER